MGLDARPRPTPALAELWARDGVVEQHADTDAEPVVNAPLRRPAIPPPDWADHGRVHPITDQGDAA